MDQITFNEIRSAVQEAFSAGIDGKRFIDITRVPLICQSIVGIDKKLEEIQRDMVTQDQFWPVKTFAYGIVGLLGTGVIGAILALILRS